MKIIVPITENSFKNDRGVIVSSIIFLLQNIFCDYIGEETFSIVPVLTKVDLKNLEEFDFDTLKSDFTEILDNELFK